MRSRGALTTVSNVYGSPMSDALTGRDLLTAIVDMREQNRPSKWIARSTGVSPRDINAILRVAGYKSRDVHDLDKYDRLELMIYEGASHTEIARTLGMDHRTIQIWFPDTQWKTGGGGWAAEIKKVEEKLRRMDRFGNVRRKD